MFKQSNRQCPPAFIESLEARQLFCGSSSAVDPAISTASIVTAATASPSILGPSEVEGTYHGDAYITADGATETIQLKAIITSTSITLYATGYGKTTVDLTAKQFIALRKGDFSVSSTIDHKPFTFNGDVTDDGDRIAGTFTAGSGSSETAGTFVVKKVVTTT